MFHRVLIAAVLAAVPSLALGQSVQQLKNQPPDGAIYTLQLTDGTVLAQGYNENDWWVLTPDNSGSYVNGTWKQVGSLPSGYEPYATASQTLADGRVLLEGGEYNFGQFAFTNLGAIYDPATTAWTSVKPPKGWVNIGDSPSSLLPNGDFLLGQKFSKRVAELNPKTLKWTELTSTKKNDFSAEEGWTLMPDGTILTADVKANPLSESYDASTGKWTNLGSTVANLQGPQNCCGDCIPYGKHDQKCYDPPGEIGPAILRADGTVFATGATHQGANTGHTAVYTPGSGWAAGPDFPNGDQAGDDFAVLLTDGDVVVEGNSGVLYDFNGTTLVSTSINAEGGSLMVLPTGQILVGGFEVFNSSGTYQSAWQPTITKYPSAVSPGSSYKISGTQFNGLSQANAFGDEFSLATNFPLVRITNTSSGHVFYAHTYDHSTMAVATGGKTVSTHFDVPSSIETGASTLVVVANGIPSASVSITVQ
ncbi:MAG TPA: hypothetical protein VHX61_07325 [Rhizomicrobium sp.]|jgi:hypothetical protein|nr:hypothetical protein [Rhizomicrobium sp.]